MEKRISPSADSKDAPPSDRGEETLLSNCRKPAHWPWSLYPKPKPPTVSLIWLKKTSGRRRVIKAGSWEQLRIITFPPKRDSEKCGYLAARKEAADAQKTASHCYRSYSHRGRVHSRCCPPSCTARWFAATRIRAGVLYRCPGCGGFLHSRGEHSPVRPRLQHKQYHRRTAARRGIQHLSYTSGATTEYRF